MSRLIMSIFHVLIYIHTLIIDHNLKLYCGVQYVFLLNIHKALES